MDTRFDPDNPRFLFLVPGFLEPSRLTGIGWKLQNSGIIESLGPHEFIYVSNDGQATWRPARTDE